MMMYDFNFLTEESEGLLFLLITNIEVEVELTLLYAGVSFQGSMGLTLDGSSTHW